MRRLSSLQNTAEKSTGIDGDASFRFFHGTAAAAFARANEIEAAADNPSPIALAKEDQPISNQPINNDSYVRRFAA